MFGFNMARLLPGGTSQRDETFFQTNQMSLMNPPIRGKYGKNFMNVYDWSMFAKFLQYN